MFVRAVIVSVLLIFVLPDTLLASPATPIATPQATPATLVDANAPKWECDKLAEYHANVVDLFLKAPSSQDVSDALNTDDFTTLRPSQARSASIGADEWATSLEKMNNIPRAALEYHKALTDSLSALSSMLLSYANGGVFAMLPYTDVAQSANANLVAASALGYARCPSQWEVVVGKD